MLHRNVNRTTMQRFLLGMLAAFLCSLLLLGAPRAQPFSPQPASAQETGNLLINGDFSDGFTAWWATANIDAQVIGGELNASITNGGSNPWDAIVGQNALPIEASETYTLTFTARASQNVSIIAKVQKEAAPYTTYFEQSVSLTSASQTFAYVFTSSFSDPAAAFQLQLGGQGTPTVYVDNVVLEGKLAATPPAEELIVNGDFSSGLEPWWAAGAVSPDINGVCVAIQDGGSNLWDTILGQSNIALKDGQEYSLSFAAQATNPLTAGIRLQQDGAPYTTYFSRDVALGTLERSYAYTFTSAYSDTAAAFQFQLGGQGSSTVCLNNIVLQGAETNLVLNGDFSSGLEPWWTSGAVAPDTSGVCVAIEDGGSNAWDAILGQNNVPLQSGKTYALSFTGYASEPVSIETKLQQSSDPYTTYFDQVVALSTLERSYAYTFTSAYSDTAAAFQFQMGGQGSPNICLNSVDLRSVPTGVRVNQVGYLPGAPKRASIVYPAASPLVWQLRAADETVVLTGTTTVYGNDSASGDFVHSADFSAFKRPGKSYTLQVGADVSHPFDIGINIYQQLKYDALAYFYHNRSGITLTMPYAGHEQWTRPAGHIGVAPNQGDSDVTCFDGVDVEGQSWPGCSYSLDVTGGWYDAGDHGKYVVNGGISVWTLLNMYERAQHLAGPEALAPFNDGKLNIPENDNGVPDLLDEVRWELEFLLKMQIPATTDSLLAGMVHHKVHDESWTGLPLPPHADPQQRYLYPPSTAATLNLAASAAQCARIWSAIDSAFAQRCLSAAETAWAAAREHPEEYARNNFTGGGPYNDSQVSDEFYWAAAELFITTGKAEYRSFLSSSPHFTETLVLDDSPTSMTWQATAALGSLSLAVVPNDLSSAELQATRDRILAAADTYVAVLNSEGYRTPFKAGSNGGYPWGSNSSVLNNMIVMALAYDLSGDTGYLEGVSEAMDYLLGRNPMDKSYVSGYGENPLQHPHHRFWARQKDAAFPPPPPGAVSGGPNSGLQDPYAQPRLAGCAPQKCYIDHIDSWSTNEITINWNAPFAWVTIFLDGQHWTPQRLPAVHR